MDKKVKVRVCDYIDKFYLPDLNNHYVSGGSVIELDVLEADRQTRAGNVKPLDDLEAKYLASKTEGDNKIIAEKDALIMHLKKELDELKKKKDLEAENIELKAELSKAKKDSVKK
jgi:hypothetical protein